MATSATELERLVVRLVGDGSDYKRSLDTAVKQTEGASRKMGGIFKKAVAGVSFVLGGLTAAGLSRSLISAAADAEEMESKFDAVFKSVAGTTRDALDEFAEAAGRGKNELRSMAADIAALVGPMGFSEQATSDMSVQLTKLATDLSSFFNVAERDALGALRAGLVGESEPLRRLGVQLSAAKIEAEAFALGLANSKEEVEGAVKAQAIMSLVMKQTKQAQGDAIRTSGSYTNQTRALGGAIQDLRVELGKYLLPAATAIVKRIRAVVVWFSKLSPTIKKVALFGTLALTVLGPLAAVIATLGPFIAAIGVAAAFAAAKLVLVVGAVAAAAAAVGYLVYKIVGRDALVGAFHKAIDIAKRWAGYVVGFIYNVRHNFEVLTTWLTGIWEQFAAMMSRVFGGIAGVVRTVLGTVAGWFGNLFGGMQGTVLGWADWVLGKVYNLALNIGALLKWLGGNWRALFDDTLNLIVIFVDNAIHNFTVMFKTLGEMFTEFGKWVAKGFEDIFSGNAAEAFEVDSLISRVDQALNRGANKLRDPLEGFESTIKALPDIITDTDWKGAVGGAFAPVLDMLKKLKFDIPKSIKVEDDREKGKQWGDEGYGGDDPMPGGAVRPGLGPAGFNSRALGSISSPMERIAKAMEKERQAREAALKEQREANAQLGRANDNLENIADGLRFA